MTPKGLVPDARPEKLQLWWRWPRSLVIRSAPIAPLQVYSRNSESSIGKYPDAAEIIKRHLLPGVTSIVIDSEVVAFDREAGKIKPFQELARRPRKVNPNNKDDLKVRGTSLLPWSGVACKLLLS